MAYYIVESYDHVLDSFGARTDGALGEPRGSEAIYLHVISVSDEQLTRLGPRIDEHGNKQHERLSLPMNEEWWIAVEGEVYWPRTVRPKLCSRCTDVGTLPRPVPVDGEQLRQLQKVGGGTLPGSLP